MHQASHGLFSRFLCTLCPVRGTKCCTLLVVQLLNAQIRWVGHRAQWTLSSVSFQSPLCLLPPWIRMSAIGDLMVFLAQGLVHGVWSRCLLSLGHHSRLVYLPWVQFSLLLGTESHSVFDLQLLLLCVLRWRAGPRSQGMGLLHCWGWLKRPVWHVQHVQQDLQHIHQQTTQT